MLRSLIGRCGGAYAGIFRVGCMSRAAGGDRVDHQNDKENYQSADAGGGRHGPDLPAAGLPLLLFHICPTAHGFLPGHGTGGRTANRCRLSVPCRWANGAAVCWRRWETSARFPISSGDSLVPWERRGDTLPPRRCRGGGSRGRRHLARGNRCPIRPGARRSPAIGATAPLGPWTSCIERIVHTSSVRSKS